MSESTENTTACPLLREPDYSGVAIVDLAPEPAPSEYREALGLAHAVAEEWLVDYMLLSWYDRDRNVEAPRHASECDRPGAIPGYLDYGLNHGARLKVDVDRGRFVFLFIPLGTNDIH